MKTRKKATPRTSPGAVPVTWTADDLAAARAQFAANQRQVLGGQTFASRKPSTFRRGKAPSSYREVYQRTATD